MRKRFRDDILTRRACLKTRLLPCQYRFSSAWKRKLTTVYFRSRHGRD